MESRSVPIRCFGELLGTFFLVLFGCGSVHAAVLTGAQSGLWQVAIVWGVAIAVTIYAVGNVSGAHINPAMTIAFACWRGFPKALVVPYVLCQLAGAMLAAGSLFILFGSFLAAKERDLDLERGKPGSELTAMCYGEYYPNPGRMESTWRTDSRTTEKHYALVSEAMAFFAEVLGTFILALSVFAVTDERNAAGPGGRIAPLFIGLTVAILISVFAPLTQACFNPARDFGPRLFAWLAGWGEIAIPGPNGRGFFTVYIIAPIVGAVIGGGVYDGVLRSPSKE